MTKNTNNRDSSQMQVLESASQNFHLFNPIVEMLSESVSAKLQSSIMPLIIDAVDKSVSMAMSKTSEPEIEWCDRRTAIADLTCTMQTLHNMINAGAIEFTKVGRRTLINRTKLQKDLKDGVLGKYHHIYR